MRISKFVAAAAAFAMVAPTIASAQAPVAKLSVASSASSVRGSTPLKDSSSAFPLIAIIVVIVLVGGGAAALSSGGKRPASG